MSHIVSTPEEAWQFRDALLEQLDYTRLALSTASDAALVATAANLRHLSQHTLPLLQANLAKGNESG